VEKPVPPRGFLPVTIVTKTGARIEGLAKNENNFSIQVLGKDEKLHLITNDEIETIQHAEEIIDACRRRQTALERRTTGSACVPCAADRKESAMKFALLALASLASAQVTYDQLRAPDPKNWVHYSGQYHSQRHSQLKQVDTQTVKDLVSAWMYHVPNARPPGIGADRRRRRDVRVVPEFRLRARRPHRRQIWEYQHQPRCRRAQSRGRGLCKQVYFGTPDAHLVALDARTGSQLWATKIAEAKDGYWVSRRASGDQRAK
jgi:hypothetical protein